MLSTKQAILAILVGYCQHWKKPYCYPSQASILKKLEEFYGVIISPRTLNRKLAWMESHGWIQRIRRHYKDIHRGMCFRSTLYKFGAMMPWIRGLFSRVADKFQSLLRLPELAEYPKKEIITDLIAPQAIGAILKQLRI